MKSALGAFLIIMKTRLRMKPLPTTAFKLGEKLDDPLKMYLSDIYTVSVNLAGLPAISIPCGTDSRSLPIGMQIIGKPFDESFILRIARFVESSRGDKQSGVSGG